MIIQFLLSNADIILNNCATYVILVSDACVKVGASREYLRVDSKFVLTPYVLGSYQL